MARLQKVLGSLHPLLPSSVASVLTVVQLALAFILPRQSSESLEWAGWIFLWAAGILALLPIVTFRRKGRVPRGKSYMATTVLVDTDIYSIVRHPQGGTAWLWINLGLMLIARHRASAMLGLASMGLVCVDTSRPTKPVSTNSAMRTSDTWRGCPE